MSYGEKVATMTNTDLIDDGALEHDKHEQRKQAIIPILIQAPQRHTEDLEHEERRGRMFPKQLGERRNRDVKLIAPVQRLQFRTSLRRQASRLKERINGRVIRARIRQTSERERRNRVDRVCVPLIVERVRRNIFRIPRKKRDDIA